MAMPGWAIGLGAALKAPEVANDYMGLFKNVQAMRDDANASEELQRIQQFKTPEEARAYKTDSYLSAASRQTLDKLRAEKLDALLKEGAAAPLSKIQDLQMDPRFRDPESVAEISRNPSEAVFGRETISNPEVIKGIEKFQAGNLSKLDRFSAAKGDRWAGAGLGKEDANAFKDVAAAQKDYAGMDEKATESRAEQDLGRFIADNPAPRTVEEWNAFWDKARKIPNLPLKLVMDQQSAMQGRNDKRIVGYKEIKVGNGPNSTVKKVPINFLGEVIEGVSATASDNPSDRELGITGGNAGPPTPRFATVSYPGPNGETIEQQIQMGDRLNDELVATIVDKAKRNVKGYHVTMPKQDKRGNTTYSTYGNRSEKGKKAGWGGEQRPGGAPAAKATGGFTYVNGELVPN